MSEGKESQGESKTSEACQTSEVVQVDYSFAILRIRFGLDGVSSDGGVRDSSIGGSGGSGTDDSSTSVTGGSGTMGAGGTTGSIGAGIAPPGMRPFNRAKYSLTTVSL